MTSAGISGAAVGSAATQAPPIERLHTSSPVSGSAPAATGERGGGRSSRRTYALLLLLAVVVGVGVRCLFVVGDHVSSPDETTYLTSGLNWWSGHGFTTISGAAEKHFPPGIPFLLGGIHEVVGGDPHTSTNIAAVLTSALTILPLAGIARLIAGRRAALLAAAIAALAPALTVLPLSSGGSAGPFTLVVVTSVWLALRARTMRPSFQMLASLLCGIGVGLAYLMRPEGLFYALVLIPMLALPVLGGWRGLRRAGAPQWRRVGLLAAAFLIPVVLLVAPYVQYLHHETGTWQLTAKTRDVSIASWRAVAEEQRTARQAILYKPGPTGFQFPKTHALTSLVRGDPGGYLDIVGINLSRLYSLTFDAATINPYPHWALLPGVLFLLAIFAAWRRRRDRMVLAVLAAIAVPAVTAIAFLMQARYLVPSAALACALVAVGLLELPARWFKVALIGTFFLIVTSTGASLYSATDGWFHPGQGYAEHKLAGEWIGAHSRPGDLVMSTTTIPGFYAHRATVPIPYAGAARVIDFARHYGVRYLIIDQANGTRFRPQLHLLAYNATRWKALKPVYRHREDGRRTVIYEIVPRPPRFHGRVPLLGQIGDSG
jgi:hypothetical protein